MDLNDLQLSIAELKQQINGLSEKVNTFLEVKVNIAEMQAQIDSNIRMVARLQENISNMTNSQKENAIRIGKVEDDALVRKMEVDRMVEARIQAIDKRISEVASAPLKAKGQFLDSTAKQITSIIIAAAMAFVIAYFFGGHH
jgi:hypothetical protein